MIRLNRCGAVVALTLTLVGAANFARPTVVQAQATGASQDQRQSYKISAGPLAQGLNRFAQQAGISLTVPSNLVEGKTTTGLAGIHTVSEGFARLLAGSGLEAVVDAHGKWVVRTEAATGTDLSEVDVRGHTKGRYAAAQSSSATKTQTLLRDVPQSVTVITSELIKDQNMQSVADVVRYVPGIVMAQGEGNRDTPIFRGSSSTADFFVDGFRDDVQYYRDLYNVERVEALKGPNAMIFGRGGAGGALNRVTKQAGWNTTRELALQGSSQTNRRMTGDIGMGINAFLAARLTGMYENSLSYRDGTHLKRYGVNPTVTMAPTDKTTVRAGYEYYDDDRTADRGIPSFNGKPVDVDPGTFFGDPNVSLTTAKAHTGKLAIEHQFNDMFTLRNRTSYGTYAKMYQNVFSGAVTDAGARVNISAYNNTTDRTNVFNQTDFISTIKSGTVLQTLLVGVEVGRQETDNFRNTGYFNNTTTTFSTAIDTPRIAIPVTFRQSATDADNSGTANTAALYVQNQMVFSRHIQAVFGVRYDQFSIRFKNNRTATELSNRDGRLSPRFGFIVKPVEELSLYTSYTMTFLPRSGDQMSSLSLTNQSLDPETFKNYEVGAKWDIRPDFSLNLAGYRLNRNNVAVADPVDPTIMTLIDGQRTLGVELGFSGQVTSRWSMSGGYAYQDGKVTENLSATILKGSRLASLPKTSVSIWNRYDVFSMLGLGLGVSYIGDRFASADNSVTLPAYTRADGAIFFKISPLFQAQLNVENLLDKKYMATAHNNNNIMPGSPRFFRFQISTSY